MLSLSIAFVGDVYLGETSAMVLGSGVADIFRATDLVVANQEGAITTGTQPIGGKCCLRSSPETARTLRNWGVDIMSLANNHVFDYGWDGFQHTRQALDDAGIAYLGAGEHLAEATKPLIVGTKGVKLGLLACAAEQTQATCATKETFGCAPLDGELITAAIRDLATQVQHVIVLPHWGYCDYVFPAPAQLDLAHRFLDAGATAVVGHHSHIVHGLVRPDDKLIAYSLGNFAFAPFTDRGRLVELSRDNHEGIILCIYLTERTITAHRVIYTEERDGGIDLDNSPARERVFAKRSAPLSLPDYTRHWQWVVRKRMIRRILYWANVLNWSKIRKDTLLGAWQMVRKMLLRSS